MSGPPEVLSLRKSAATLRDQGRLAETEALLRKAVLLAPSDGDAHAELGLTLAMMGRSGEAEPCYRRALEINPLDAFSLGNLGAALLQAKRVDEAAACFRQVLEIEPGQPQALRNLGVILKDAARLVEAKACFLEASRRDTSLEASLQAHLAVSAMAQSAGDIDVQRSSYAAGLEAFAAEPRRFRYQGERISVPWFFLPYHGRDDRALMQRTAQVLAAKVPPSETADTSPALSVDPAREGRRIRIAFCSEFLHDHTIGRLYRGLIAKLDRRRFEVVVLHGPFTPSDAFRTALDAGADRALSLPRAPEAQRLVLRELRPDVLFFPEIGMSPQTWFLARERLAPVQVASWGHPNTTGLASIDYFLSAASLEPAGAEAHYMEQLVKLPRLPTFYEAPGPTPVLPRSALRLPESGTLYGCPQSPFKFHPDFDPVLAEIAEGDPTAHIVLIEGRNAAWAKVLRERWGASHPILLERVQFLPRLSQPAFMALLAHIDVLLDPLHFGSGNTLYEAMAFGTPIVSWPGAFMRGRVVAGAYAQMGVDRAPIAQTPRDYAPIALALGRDPARRAQLRAELHGKARTQLYEDAAAVGAIEAFLDSAVAAAARGAKLPADWSATATERPA